MKGTKTGPLGPSRDEGHQDTGQDQEMMTAKMGSGSGDGCRDECPDWSRRTR